MRVKNAELFPAAERNNSKYIAIVSAIAGVLAFLIWLLRKAAKTNRDLLVKRYREGYRNHSWSDGNRSGCPTIGSRVEGRGSRLGNDGLVDRDYGAKWLP
ncbi:MAG: hypothetical protein ACC661_09760 [Verrucomicrobiales bacterium]